MNPIMTGLRSFSTSTRPRTLLLTFDAFGTLFYPHPPVPEQYASTAHEFGLSRTAITPKKLEAAFKDIYRAQASRWPNYGRADVLRGKYGGPRQWWEEVIQESFARVLASEAGHLSTNQEKFELPPGLVDALVDRFAGDGGYALFEDVAPFFARMRELRSAATRQSRFDRVLLGVVSNSDDRVPAVLKALGLRVGDMRADQDLSSMELPGFEQRGGVAVNDGQCQSEDVDVDLVITSYEAGEGKPHRLIFDVAKRQARLLARDQAHTHGSIPAGVDETDDWVCVHVGDEYEKDYRAAINAGWKSYLIPRGNAQEYPAETIDSLLDLIEELKMQA
ncbi:putative haloacid dehalogenase-like hydrolase [Aspergillus sclerotiicarbonarius CBS 121057]|uniref:Putative haloacid dehalogenase-like hydrolase n=1 Tax=Aspergillus sclerotiicarbonarius (strain CBS 121057 / IBT 28362) TaxID=1448318 RepID=A0A319F2Z2_ASPSB|nr:putative haloacid dehalogenase-like hydrolase [Aspergillus sclerotiicarbonarius CBS 121057]